MVSAFHNGKPVFYKSFPCFKLVLNLDWFQGLDPLKFGLVSRFGSRCWQL